MLRSHQNDGNEENKDDSFTKYISQNHSYKLRQQIRAQIGRKVA